MRVEQTHYVQRTTRRALSYLPLWAAYDLVLLSVLALLLPVLPLVPFSLVRVPLGLAMALLAPGYALVAALFPRRDEMGGAVRAALSFGLSAAVIPLLALILDRLPWGIRPLPIAISLACFIVLAASVGLVRRSFLRPRYAALPPAIDPLGWWYQVPGPARIRLALGTLMLALVFGAGTYALIAPDPSEQLTEFYVLGRQGLAEDYPQEVGPNMPLQIPVGIINREGGTVSYRVEVRSRNTVLAQAGPVELANGARWEQTVSYTLREIGNDQQVDILLFRDNSSEPYRRLRLWVNVLESGK